MKHCIAYSVVALVGGVAQAQGAFIAINDVGGSSPTGSTNYTIGSKTSGLLKDFDTNADTAVTLTVSTPSGYQSASSDADASKGAMPDSGTDAYNVFNGKLNASGYLWYGTNNTNSRTRFTFTGLSSDAIYTLTLFGNRADAAYTTRYTVTELVGADSFTNTSSTGTTVNGAVTTMLSGANSATGYVAQYSNIIAGDDGTFYVDVYGTSLGDSQKWYLSGLALAEVPEPASLSMVALAGLTLMRRRRV